MVVYPRDVVLDPVVFAKRLREDRIDAVFQTPAHRHALKPSQQWKSL